MPDSGAEEAGVRTGDVIVAIDGEATPDSASVGEIVRGREVDDVITITLHRAGETVEVEATLRRRG